jgi:hypothetical protein
VNAFLTDSLAVVYVWHFTATTVCCSRVLDVHTLLSAQDIDAGRSRADRSSERQATVRGAGRAGAKVSWPHVVEQRCDSGARGGCEWAVARGVPVGGAGCAPRSRPDARLRWPENLLQTVCLCRRSISVFVMFRVAVLLYWRIDRGRFTQTGSGQQSRICFIRTVSLVGQRGHIGRRPNGTRTPSSLCCCATLCPSITYQAHLRWLARLAR